MWKSIPRLAACCTLIDFIDSLCYNLSLPCEPRVWTEESAQMTGTLARTGGDLFYPRKSDPILGCRPPETVPLICAPFPMIGKKRHPIRQEGGIAYPRIQSPENPGAVTDPKGEDSWKSVIQR